MLRWLYTLLGRGRLKLLHHNTETNTFIVIDEASRARLTINKHWVRKRLKEGLRVFEDDLIFMTSTDSIFSEREVISVAFHFGDGYYRSMTFEFNDLLRLDEHGGVEDHIADCIINYMRSPARGKEKSQLM
jgi:hypothetical protein